MTPIQKRTAGILILAIVLFGSSWAIKWLRPAKENPPPFAGDQWITAEIVTVPTRTTRDGREYDEEFVLVRSSHRFPVAASGEGQSVTSMDGDFAAQFFYTSARPSDDGNGIVLADLRIFFPHRFQISDNAGLQWLSFGSTDTTITTDPREFRRRVNIHYQGEDLPNSFLRMRIDPHPNSHATLDLRIGDGPDDLPQQRPKVQWPRNERLDHDPANPRVEGPAA